MNNEKPSLKPPIFIGGIETIPKWVVYDIVLPTLYTGAQRRE